MAGGCFSMLPAGKRPAFLSGFRWLSPGPHPALCWLSPGPPLALPPAYLLYLDRRNAWSAPTSPPGCTICHSATRASALPSSGPGFCHPSSCITWAVGEEVGGRAGAWADWRVRR